MGLARAVHDITRNLVSEMRRDQKRRIAQLGFRRNECDLTISQHEQLRVYFLRLSLITPSHYSLVAIVPQVAAKVNIG